MVRAVYIQTIMKTFFVDPVIRAMAYAILQAFLKHHGDHRGDLEEYQRLQAQGIHFDVTHQVFLLKQLRNSIEEENMRLGCGESKPFVARVFLWEEFISA